MMLSIIELEDFLRINDCDFEILEHDTPIISTQDATKYFDIEKAAPTFIMDTEQGLVALIVSSKYGRIDFKVMKQKLEISKCKMADKERIKTATGYEIGTIPLLGHNLPCIVDENLLSYDFIYGGSGDGLHTLKIAPNDIMRLNNVIKRI